MVLWFCLPLPSSVFLWDHQNLREIWVLGVEVVVVKAVTVVKVGTVSILMTVVAEVTFLTVYNFLDRLQPS